uniref:Uncharacterized protein n=1 Tax=Geospiza parvula TaxID=87175 RepID=A0A8U8C7U8_GEOPR
MLKLFGLKEMKRCLMVADLNTFLMVEREFLLYIMLILKMLPNILASSQALVQQENLLYMVRVLLWWAYILEKKLKHLKISNNTQLGLLHSQVKNNIYISLQKCFLSELAAEFLTRPQNLEVLEGEKAEFVCSVSKEAITVQWLRGDTVLEPGDKYDIISDGKKRTLVVKESVLGDTGMYTVMVGEAKATAHLAVIGKFYFINDQEVTECQEIIFNCEVNKEGAKEKWYKNDEAIFDSAKYIVVQKGHSLIIKDCGFVDEGEYTVTAGQDKSVAELLITEAPADFTEHLQDQTVTEFDDAVFTCQLSKEKVSVKWYRNGREIKEGKKYFEKDGNLHRLIIKDCRLDDECEYSCGVDDRRSRARLFVEGMCKIGWDLFQHYLIIVKWLRNNMIIIQGDKHQMMSEGKVHRLQVCDIKPRDQGEYRFIAKDKEARAKLELAGKLLVLSAPKIKTGDQNLVVDVGKPLTMTVPYDAYPRAEAEWFKAGESLPTTTVDTTTDCTTFKIYEAKKSDKGRYRIVLRNKHGQAEAFINVEVIDVPGPVRNLEVTETYDGEVGLAWQEPESDGGSKIIGYVVERRDIKRKTWIVATDRAENCEYTVTGLQKGGVEYLFRVSARNRVGTGEPVETDTPVEAKNVPGPPQNVEVSDVNRFGATLSWEPPEDDGGSPITGYVIELRNRATIRWEPAMTTGVTGLKQGSSYYYRVSAENAAGVSDPAEAIGPLTADDAFEAPEIFLDVKLLAGLTVKAGTKIELPAKVTGKPEPQVTWTKADKILRPDNRITIESQPNHSTVTITDSKRSDSGTYIIEVCKQKINIHILSSTDKPGPPAAFDVTEITNESCLLTWNPPRDDGGSKITNYVLEKRATDSEIWDKLSSTIKDTKFRATNLTPHKEYVFRVSAENMYGVGEPAQCSPIIAKYSFDEDGGSPITGYWVERYDPEQDKWIKCNKMPVKDTTFK